MNPWSPIGRTWERGKNRATKKKVPTTSKTKTLNISFLIPNIKHHPKCFLIAAATPPAKQRMKKT